MHGDGTSLWTLTHHADFARGFVPLLGHPRTVGEAFHITSDDALDLGPDRHAASPRPLRVRGPASCTCPRTRSPPPTRSGARACSGDKAHSMVFDNTKLRSVVPGYVATIPFEQGAREIVAWHDEDPARQQVDARLDAVMDRLVEAYRRRDVQGPRDAGVPG